MTYQIQTRRLITAEKATYVAPSQVPWGESLEDEVFQPLFVSKRNFKPASTILQIASQRSIYFNVKEAYNKIIQKFEGEVIKLSFNKKDDIIGKEFPEDLFFRSF